ncbi:brain and acute leukemia cytoplasmic protein-like isoform X2 [Scleropages formosus]|uniref:brain and acute leukemia cytoplasmic protein-like isoform X2 n=1 Tax=Scleropages formosus TaxID=113540 RepID=UPI0010FAAE5E|nr:brain and acute leukemia cytoplasmic protein isoform X2 [Scleropages formosus]
MGCGGSRADALEPRYYESWTRETESTWLTNTDAESSAPPPGAEDGAPARANTARVLEATSSHREKKMVNIGTQCGKQLGSGGKHQRRPGGREEVKKMATKEGSVAKVTQLVTSGEATLSHVK